MYMALFLAYFTWLLVRRPVSLRSTAVMTPDTSTETIWYHLAQITAGCGKSGEVFSNLLWYNWSVTSGSRTTCYRISTLSTSEACATKTHLLRIRQRKKIFVFPVTRPTQGKTPRPKKVFVTFWPKSVPVFSGFRPNFLHFFQFSGTF